jgi:hypothetical protein
MLNLQAVQQLEPALVMLNQLVVLPQALVQEMQYHKEVQQLPLVLVTHNQLEAPQLELELQTLNQQAEMQLPQESVMLHQDQELQI